MNLLSLPPPARAAYENLVKTQRLRQEMAQAKKDVEQYLGKVEEAQELKKMEGRKGLKGAAKEVAAEQAKVRERRGGGGGGAEVFGG